MSNLIGIPTATGLKIVHPKEIKYGTADGSYTEIYLENGEKIVASKNLKALETKLPNELFLRIHHKYLVNRFYVSEIAINGGCYVVLKCGTKLEVSQKKKASVIASFEKL